ncbi:MAG: peptidoglycan DD-metalloendopeptidase family protein [Candidatus Peribacteraceae bacterium]|nr:peptidoglycan DD-metalloendopeptidase family protein [Candidatus Peribacteraceae bacterium]
MYPFPLLHNRAAIHPLFGPALKGDPLVFDFSSKNPWTKELKTDDVRSFQDAIDIALQQAGKQWGIGRYLEERATVLRHYPQMIREGRIFHVGLDITALPGTSLYAPIDSTVFRIGKEEGIGNYGGYVMLRHELEADVFYSFYGHLNARHIVKQGDKLAMGQRFAVIGDWQDSGGWFTHTHLQILTQQAVDAGRMFQGYVAPEDLPTLNDFFPSPYPLFRY